MTFDPAAGPLAVTRTDLGPFGPAESRAGTTDPGPNSAHGGSFNVIFADGRGSTLSTAIAPGVFVRLMTPAGTNFGEKPVHESNY